MDIQSPRRGMDGVRPLVRPVLQRAPQPSVQLVSQMNQTPFQQRMLDGVVVAKKSDMAALPSGRERVYVWARKFVVTMRTRVQGWWQGKIPRLKAVRWSFSPSPRQAFYLSLVGGVAFGVFVTAFSFMLFDHGVSAQSDVQTVTATAIESPELPTSQVFPENQSVEAGTQEDVFLEYFSEAAEEEYRAKITDMVKGYPIEAMLPYIFEQDRTVAAFLIGIAKKESNWGKRVPVLEGQDCFNYWGYRGVRRLMGTGGHTCFNSRKDAVDTVARRITTLVYSERLNTPEKMILWKCGFSCQGHSRESVKKWISDVDMYFSQLDEEGY